MMDVETGEMCFEDARQATSQGIQEQAATKSWKCKETNSPLRVFRRKQPLILAQ